jgi:uncharacterized protein YcbX
MGLQNDRRLMAVDAEGIFLTQREHARLALIRPELNGGSLTLSAPGMDDLTIPVRRLGERVKVEVWRSTGVESVDQGDIVAEWLSKFLKMPARLVRMADDYQRKVNPDFAVQPDDHVSFADAYPILLISQASLDDLNSRLARPIPMNRFRPNLVVAGTAPFAEDGWKRIRIGEVELALVKQCSRCHVPTIDQDTLEKSKEPTATLATYRSFDGKVMFGTNVIPLNEGGVQVGDIVEILS